MTRHLGGNTFHSRTAEPADLKAMRAACAARRLRDEDEAAAAYIDSQFQN